MNDFTKEELIWLEEELECAMQDFSQPDICYEIHAKLSVLIDNYCDHESYDLLYLFGAPQRRCKKCGALYR